LEDQGLVKQKRGFLFASPGPRKFVEITPDGEQAIKSHLELIRNAIDRALASQPEPHQKRD
jgi:DNA-binding MarR family transcriptional regulator